MLCVNARFLCRQVTGAQRYAIEIARRMRQLDPSIRFLAPHDVQHEELAQELGVEIVGRRRGIAWEQIDLPRALRRMGRPRPLLLGLTFTAPLLWRPTIIVVHDVVFLHREWVSAGFHWYYRLLVPRLCRRASRVVTVSEFSKGEIARRLGVPADKIDVVPNAVSPEFVRLADGQPRRYEGDYVLGVATLQPRKNFAALVRAFRRADVGDTKLVIVGSTDLGIYGRDAGLSDLLEDDRIVLTGYVSDAELAALYRDATLFVYPSLYEGFGIPPLEAMSLGCPVITSNTSSLPEVCGDAALLVDPRDETALAAAIERALRDPALRRDLIQRGFANVQRYDWTHSAYRTRSIAASNSSAE